jgi:hypothetical protein
MNPETQIINYQNGEVVSMLEPEEREKFLYHYPEALISMAGEIIKRESERTDMSEEERIESDMMQTIAALAITAAQFRIEWDKIGKPQFIPMAAVDTPLQ